MHRTHHRSCVTPLRYANLLQTAKTHEEMAAQAAREAQLRAEELRLLRAEVTQLRNQNVEMKRKMQVRWCAPSEAVFEQRPSFGSGGRMRRAPLK
jgi:hypothetical protein